MKIKIYKLKSKLLIVFGTLLLVWIIFGILSVTSLNKINKFHSLKTEIAQLGNELQEMSEINQELGLQQGMSEQFYNDGENEVTDLFEEKLKTIKSETEKILDSDYFFYKKGLSESLHSIQDDVTNIRNDFQDLKTALLERGNENVGLISQWNSQIANVTDQNYQINSFELSEGIEKLRNLFNEYIENPSPNPINQMTETAERLKSISVEPDTTGALPAIDLSGVQQSLNDITAISNQILEQDIIIGNLKGGLIHSIDTHIADIESVMNEIEDEITTDYNKARNRSRTKIIIFWIMFILLTCLAYFITEKFLATPLVKIRQFAGELSKGLFPGKLQLSENDETAEISNDFNTFTESLSHKSEFARELGEDNISNELPLLSEDDMLGKSLISLREKLSVAKEEDKKRAIETEKRRWINEGLAKFGDILRQNNDNLEQLSINLITHLVKYLNATQGGLFLLNDEDKENVFLELKSAIAYNRQKFLEKKIELGEGLVGTCAIEKKTILLTEIPEEYLEITSGLGDANPNCLLIVPLNLEEETLGVIELASFNEFKDFEIEFVEKISESIASTLTAVKVNERTTELLAQSQKQAAEMSEQEEEMRQNMEELQATQEEASRRENEITSILNAIDSTSLVVEYDMNGYITKINDKFLEILEIPKTDIIGVHHSNFTSKSRTENSYIEFWNTLKSGKSVTTVEVIKLLNGKKLWLNQNYSPIVNNDNQPYKIINIAIDITETKVKEQSLDKRDREIARKTNEIDLLNVAINEAIIKCDLSKEGIIINANDNYAEIMGYTLDAVIGKNVFDFLNKEEKETYKKIWEYLESNKPYKEVLKHTLPDGSDRFVISSFTPVTDEDGNTYKIYYLGQDITEQKLKYDLLVEANKEIERLKKLTGEE